MSSDSNTSDAPAEEKPFISGIILAAGRSQRMKDKGPKQLLRVDGQTLLEHVIRAAAESQLDELVVVLGHRAESVLESLQIEVQTPLRIALTPDFDAGQSRALRTGLAAADPRAKAAAILLGDQPDLPATTIDRAIQAWLQQRPPLLRPQYASPSGKKQPGHPVVICRKIWPIIESLHGDEGAREVIRSHPEWLETLPLPGLPPVDIDRMEDWKKWVGSR
jgi:molybdenum cofactor cytidylyltransferase